MVILIGIGAGLGAVCRYGIRENVLARQAVGDATHQCAGFIAGRTFSWLTNALSVSPVPTARLLRRLYDLFVIHGRHVYPD